MNKVHFAILTVGLIVHLAGCGKTSETGAFQTASDSSFHYISIDGFWRVTPETAIKYPHGTLEPVLQITGDAQGNPVARGCFLWEKRFYDYWEIDSIRVTANRLTIFYDEEGVYRGFVDEKKRRIKGLACWGEPSDTNRLEFIRDEETDLSQLFIPYPPGRDGSIKYTYHQPDDCNDQMHTASVFNYVNDSAAFYSLMEKIIKQKYGRLESFLVIKDQKLVLEEYFYGYNRSRLHPIHSCTKSITSLLLGISLEQNGIYDVKEPVFNFFPQYDSLKTPEKENITLEQVLTMTSGLPEDDEFEKNDPDDLVTHLLCQPLLSFPGDKFSYNNNGTNLLGCIIFALEKKQADEFAKEVLFSRLGISEYYWPRENDVAPCYSELHMLPRDMARIGLLVLNYGFWNGDQIVPKDWIASSTKPYVAESEYFDYGYQWWYRSGGNRSWWESPVHGSNDEQDMFLALGYGGQYIMVVRDMNMVIVITSSDYNEENGMAHQKIPMVIEEVVPLFD